MAWSGLGIKGVPLEVVFRLTDSDVRSQPYAAARAAFELRRGPGTPLLAASSEKSERKPAPYLRSTLAQLLEAKAAGKSLLPHFDPIVEAAAAELHLALVESVSAYVASLLKEATSEPLPVVPPTTNYSSIRFSASLRSRPNWLKNGIWMSLRRLLDAADQSLLSPDLTDSVDEVIRLRDESAYWLGVAPTGREGAQEGAALGASLGIAAKGDILDVPDFYPPEVFGAPELPDWLREARLALARGTNPPPAPDGALASSALRHFAEGAKDAEFPAYGRQTFVVGPETVGEFLRTFDVMDDYELEPLPN